MEALIGPCILAAAPGLVLLLAGKPKSAIILVLIGPTIVLGTSLLFYFAYALILQPDVFIVPMGMALWVLPWPIALLYVASVLLSAVTSRTAATSESHEADELAPWIKEMRREQVERNRKD